MPEADRIFLETGSYQKARKTVIELYNHYLEDMPLYQASNESKLRSETIFKTIYSQLSKESKNFKPGIVQKGLRNRDLESPLDWLSLAHLVYRSTMVKERVSLPLMEAKEALYRLYLSDSGIFSYESQVEPTAFLSQTGRMSWRLWRSLVRVMEPLCCMVSSPGRLWREMPGPGRRKC